MRRVVPRDILERLTPGDLVVHIDHGIARYERMLRRGGGEGEERDYLELAFPASDRIFVPVEQIDRVTRYSGGENPALSQARRHRLAADEGSGSARPSPTSPRSCSRCTPPAPPRRGHAFADDTPVAGRRWRPSFPYEETVDQLRAAAEVKARHGGAAGRWTGWSSATSATARPRSRCGPRSRRPRTASRSPCSCPTTVLAAQHFATFSQRFAAFPLEGRGCCRGSSRRRSRSRRSTGSRTAPSTSSSGRTGCCRKDVGFQDLGLVVVDEEQRFGVAAKERLKQLRREVDVLTLSATPIPRTLNLALAGVRDL